MRRPPWFIRLLGRLLPARDREFILGDLEEAYAQRVVRDGRGAAARRYALHLCQSIAACAFRWFARSIALGEYRDDLTQGWRSLSRKPGPGMTTVLVLSLGVGATTAIFSILDGAVLSPLPFPEPDRLVGLYESSPSRNMPRRAVAAANYLDWVSSSSLLRGAAAYGSAALPTLTGRGEPFAIRVIPTEPDLFAVLGTRPALGGTLPPADQGASTVVLSHALWETRFGADEAVVGSTIRLNGRPYVVVGVMPAGFSIPTAPADAWVPLPISATEPRYYRRLRVIARIRPGRTVAAAQDELSRIGDHLASMYPSTNEGWTVVAWPLIDAVIRPSTRRGVWMLFVVVGLMVLVGAANVATVGLARATAREHEIAVRSAMGAGLGRILRQLLAESAILALSTAILATGIAHVAILAARSFGSGMVPRLEAVHVDSAASLFGLALSTAVVFVASLLPALGCLRGTALHARGGAPRHPGAPWKRDGLIALQVALSVVLLAGSALMVRSFYRVQQRALGFDPKGLLALPVTLPGSSYPDSVVYPTFAALLARLAAVPGVEAVSGADRVPFVDGNSIITFAPDLPEPLSREDAPDTDMRIVAPNYFRTLGIRVLRGNIETFDDPLAGAVAMVSETAARTLWGPDVDPIGRRFRLSDPATGTAFTIVGVVSDIRAYSIENRRMRPMVYLPQAVGSGRTLDIAVRVSTSNTGGVVEALRAEVMRLDPDLARPDVTPVADALSGTMDTRRFQTWCVSAFASFAVLLVLSGLFGLTSLMARQRRREIGIRLALGARPATLVALLSARGMAVALVGAGLGTTLGLVMAPRIASLLFQTSPRDGVSFVAAVGLVVVVASLASAVPAWSAGRGDPSDILRGD